MDNSSGVVSTKKAYCPNDNQDHGNDIKQISHNCIRLMINDYLYSTTPAYKKCLSAPLVSGQLQRQAIICQENPFRQFGLYLIVEPQFVANMGKIGLFGADLPRKGDCFV